VKLYCALCGRPMDQAAVMIGSHPVGPKCAQRAGLLPLAQRKSGLVFHAQRRKIEKAPQAKTLDMFEVMA